MGIGYKEEKRRKELEKQKLMEAEIISEMESHKREIKELVEKIRFQINNPDMAEEYSGKETPSAKVFWTSIPAVDSLLNYKKKTCEKKFIEATLDIGKLPSAVLPESEMIRLIGNVIDNAIEAAEQCESKWIKIQLKVVKGMLVLRVTNSKLKEHSPLANGMQTTKENKKEHGIGRKVIKKIVSRNKGYFKEYDKGDSFEVFITLPIKEAV